MTYLIKGNSIEKLTEDSCNFLVIVNLDKQKISVYEGIRTLNFDITKIDASHNNSSYDINAVDDAAVECKINLFFWA